MRASGVLWVIFGGALGTLARFWLTQVSIDLLGSAFPWGTIGINILGSFVIGLFGELSIPAGPMPLSQDIRLFVMVGICGGFTTFSSFSLQTVNLLREGDWAGALLNIGVSVIACVLMTALGIYLGQRIVFVLRGGF